ncbi:MAG: AAA family ATPase [Lachnospiraceae bacterium]|nr:AAA family ATPase [Lachnospiraceae bacterium]
MKISKLKIKNFKSIRELSIEDVDNAVILVGKNNTGKTAVMHAIQTMVGAKPVEPHDFNDPVKNIEVEVSFEITEEDLDMMHERGIVSRFKKREAWDSDFAKKLPSFADGELKFTFIAAPDGRVSYNDGFKTNNPNILNVLPKVYFIDSMRNMDEIEDDIFHFQGNKEMAELKEKVCVLSPKRVCNHCFQCVEQIKKKTPDELSLAETTRLLEYKLFHTNLSDFADRLNEGYHRNSGKKDDIVYRFDMDVDKVLALKTSIHNKERDYYEDIHQAGASTKSIYIMSLLETYTGNESSVPSIIMMEEPEIYLHPQLQKATSEVLYRLSKKNQVFFSTHSPNMLFNFSTKQIKQVVLDENYSTVVREGEEIDEILDDLGYAANDLMNVSFVFIVEGKQDRSRLPLLLEKHYSEIYDEDGRLQRISIINTNSCTNIKTYANLKYINQLYLKDQFLMIRDSDGKKPEYLVKQLCNYYKKREGEDEGYIPRVTPKNVLVLKYYSFENYFLDPEIMTKIGVVKSVDEFYTTLYRKFKEHLYKLTSVKRMQKIIGVRINSKQDVIDNMENFRIFVRGHNLFDIFYGRYNKEEEERILRKYIDIAPRESFADIFEAIDRFVYFENRKKEDSNEE